MTTARFIVGSASDTGRVAGLNTCAVGAHLARHHPEHPEEEEVQECEECKLQDG